jgi:hypothetical protein
MEIRGSSNSPKLLGRQDQAAAKPATEVKSSPTAAPDKRNPGDAVPSSPLMSLIAWSYSFRTSELAASAHQNWLHRTLRRDTTAQLQLDLETLIILSDLVI